jgi:hypothetical protein
MIQSLTIDAPAVFQPLEARGASLRVSGAHFGIHVTYWAACHKLQVEDPFDSELGRKFGYPTALPEDLADEKRVANPFEVLEWTIRPGL